jgi:hypothetical protein
LGDEVEEEDELLDIGPLKTNHDLIIGETVKDKEEENHTTPNNKVGTSIKVILTSSQEKEVELKEEREEETL